MKLVRNEKLVRGLLACSVARHSDTVTAVVARHGAPWDANEDEQLKSLAAQNIHRKQIAAFLGRTQEAVNARLRKICADSPPTANARKLRKRRKSGASFFLS
jgi:hypothetical protein